MACGRLDGFWEFGLHPWDMAAGRLIVAEAGGCFTDMNGVPHNLQSPHLVADNGRIHTALLDTFREIFNHGPRVLPLPPAK